MRFTITTYHYGNPGEQEFCIVPNDESLPSNGNDEGYYSRTLTAEQALDLAEAMELTARAVLALERAKPTVKPEPEVEPEPNDDDNLPL